MATYCFDIDGTICTNTNGHYNKAKPFQDMLERINRLYGLGHKIIFMTARGCVSNIDYTDYTKKQLKEWGFKYHQLITNQKPHADFFIDDRGENVSNWRIKGKKVGFVASSFDLIHPGYVLLLKDAKKVCEHLICALHEDPSIERAHKNKPIQTLQERIMVLEAIRYVDEVVVYKTEKELYNLLKKIKPDVRILGTDYKNNSITGSDLEIEIYFHERNHNWSTTNLKNKILLSHKNK